MATVEKRSLARSLSRSLGVSSSSSNNGSSSSKSDSTTHGFSEPTDVVQRPLAFPDELMVMRKDQALLLVESFNPIDGRKVVWYEDPELSRLGVNIQGQQVTPLLSGPAVVDTVDVTTGEPAVAPAT